MINGSVKLVLSYNLRGKARYSPRHCLAGVKVVQAVEIVYSFRQTANLESGANIEVCLYDLCILSWIVQNSKLFELLEIVLMSLKSVKHIRFFVKSSSISRKIHLKIY